jgi:hypothetical protein
VSCSESVERDNISTLGELPTDEGADRGEIEPRADSVSRYYREYGNEDILPLSFSAIRSLIS